MIEKMIADGVGGAILDESRHKHDWKLITECDLSII